MFRVVFNYFDSFRNRRLVQIQSQDIDFQAKTANFDEDSENWEELSTETLINKVLEWDYRQHMVGRFINEAVEITESKAKEMTELAEKMKKVFADSESQLASFKERSELAQGSIVEMTEMVFEHELRLSMLEGGANEELDLPLEDTTTELEGGE